MEMFGSFTEPFNGSLDTDMLLMVFTDGDGIHGLRPLVYP